jgi:AraC-like DNA-binding protein
LEDIAGRSGIQLLEQMVEAPPRDAVHRLAQFLSERVNSPTAAPADLLDGVTSVFELAQALHSDRKSAYNRLLRVLGLAPKLALRINRLHRALLLLNRGCSLADAAASAGYSDQAHFSRETVRLLGEPPGKWRHRRNCSFVQDK